MIEPRLAALKAIVNILEQNVFIDDALSSALSSHNLNKKDRSLVTELVYGVTRNKLTLDFLLSKVCNRNLKQLSPQLKNILRLAVYQLEYTRIPDYATVNTSVEMTKTVEKKNTSSFVNGVLRTLIRERANIKFPEVSTNPICALSVKYSHPEWLIKRWLNLYGLDNTIRLLEFNNKPAQTTINVNKLKSTLEEVLEEFKNINIDPVISTISPNCAIIGNVGNINDLPGYNDGHWFVQNEVSSLVIDILSPQEGETILDLCAAPGTKTVQIAGYMKNKGKIIAVELNPSRLTKLNQNCYRLGATNVDATIADATIFSLSPDNLADRILLDAPCSNTGVFSKRADARWHRTSKDLSYLSELQLKLFNNAAKSIKPEGIIVYSVCSIEPEEGISVINAFLKANANFALLNINDFLPLSFKNTFTTKYAQFLPFEHHTDGFFIAIVKKSY